MTYSHSLGISGGGDKSDYSFTVSRLDQENVLSNKFTRMNLSSNLGFELFKGFTFRNITQTIFENENLLSGSYSLTIKDNSNCIKTSVITILSNGGPSASAGSDQRFFADVCIFERTSSVHITSLSTFERCRFVALHNWYHSGQ